MTAEDRRKLHILTIFSAAAFAGGNLFIGLSMGAYWLSLGPEDYIAAFFTQWLRFLLTIMPLLLMTLYGLIRSAALDKDDPARWRLWRRALAFWIATCLITLVFHMPLNLRLGAATFTAEEAAGSALYGVLSIFGTVTTENAGFTRAIWLLGHIPRVLLAIALSIVAMQAVFQWHEIESKTSLS
ncbi:hypothetical protein ROJ8625_01035 [Roseivivax jejudonensis]|uniref:Uncharacterized protein n=1 Tax=Roseivivax jejudonensis TaxID=1529041 RepID=A0A1X6YMU5_9RHOB|nr:hypothetical protein [Roseivivax jejudonensis]SLN26009.1 hypothetical protein ROJ8625_01035 [Roseivivax jejudonensis]